MVKNGDAKTWEKPQKCIKNREVSYQYLLRKY